jgi:hypothetical protein
VAREPAAQAEIDRLTAEVARLRGLERHVRQERERIRVEGAAEIERLQSALREAASRAGERRDDIDRRLKAAEDAEHALAAHEERVRVADMRLREWSAQLEAEQQRLADERQRLEQESARLAEWEREIRRGTPAAPLPATFEVGLSRLAKPGPASRSPADGSW